MRKGNGHWWLTRGTNVIVRPPIIARNSKNNPAPGDIFVHIGPETRQIWLMDMENTWVPLPANAGSLSAKPISHPSPKVLDQWLYFPSESALAPDVFDSKNSPSWVQWETILRYRRDKRRR